jgi:shikimate kinase
VSAPYLITLTPAAASRTSASRGSPYGAAQGRGHGHYPGFVHVDSRPTLVIVGPPGAGKTTVGRVLARRLGVAFADVDAMIEQRTGRAIADLFLEDGEDGFRTLERQVVAEALGSHDGVLALGGGAVLAAETRALLRAHRVVHLSVGLADGLRRTGMSTARPLLAGVNPRATFKALLDARAPLYREVATVQVATDRRSANQVARAVLEAIGEVPASAPQEPVDPDNPLDRPTPRGGSALPDPTVRL